jgi:cell division initiation protein
MLTKADIVNTIFSKALYGYSRGEVDQFVQELSEEVGARDEEIERLHEQISSLQSKLNEYEQREKDLRDTLLTTHKMVDDIKQNAEKEAEVIVEQAKVKAQDIVAQAQNRSASIEEECLQLQKQRIQFKTRLKSLLETYQQFLDMEEENEQPESETEEAKEG